MKYLPFIFLNEKLTGSNYVINDRFCGHLARRKHIPVFISVIFSVVLLIIKGSSIFLRRAIARTLSYAVDACLSLITVGCNFSWVSFCDPFNLDSSALLPTFEGQNFKYKDCYNSLPLACC